MFKLTNKRIILGVTGGIAAYKSAELVRRLQDQGAQVRVVMTPGAEEFVRPLTMQALSGHPVFTGLLDEKAEAGMGHIELAKWGDLLLIAPASADFIANMVHGRADSLLGAIYLATPALVSVAPAMNHEMWKHPATSDNVDTLRDRQVHVIGPDSGIQACGDIGPGRMVGPEIIVDQISEFFKTGELQGIHVVITAGPTREALDPVRYVSNYSSGKMGYAIASAAIDAGALVTLISGPVNLIEPEGCKFVSVVSTEEMLSAVLEVSESAHIFIGAAAVSDYKIESVSEEKIKSNDETLTLTLRKSPDIIQSVAKKYEQLFVVGFAAESNNLEGYAKEKLEKKGLDAIIANDISRSDIGFNSDSNEVSWIDKNSSLIFSKRSKTQLARDIIQQILKSFHHNR
ncbi:MAG: bifunctional phosphopantothenoylcysteine decarboxylase/phosphopantothenate--cysteine ligase CoaBC [Porticoccaceae bacterium]|jgi:phosphopantothenoylcysteine decarboxylase/phosphopantothenate--cysteine ligase|nr:bifunctional phosphopantothenoylcysteine decarboxylase/phosphopantothenate--cysteine ligase CoaBC [Porticoccaceae bacterium]|tara:strand:+ start:10675 stop:11877 length:1203 start_codon:yes stop_codon:yes gene_type:complete